MARNPLNKRNKDKQQQQQVKEHPYSGFEKPMKEHPYTVYQNAMSEEAKRERLEKSRLQRLEKRHRKNSKNKVLLMTNDSNHTDSDSCDEHHDPAYEVIVMPQKPRSALEIYLMDQDANGRAKTKSQSELKLQWRKLSVEEKVLYENLALDDRLRFQHEKKMYRRGRMEGEDVDKKKRLGRRKK